MCWCLVNLQRAGKATLRAKLPANINHSFRGCKISASGDKVFSRRLWSSQLCQDWLPHPTAYLGTGCPGTTGGRGDGVQPAAGLSETQPGEPLLGSRRDTQVTALEAPSSLDLVGATTCAKPGSWRRLTGDHLEVYTLGSVTVATLVRDFLPLFHC